MVKITQHGDFVTINLLDHRSELVISEDEARELAQHLVAHFAKKSAPEYAAARAERGKS
jgi:hypothetical protein